MPTVSIIMSVYNDRKYLRKSIESMLKQTFIDFEFIIVDDCSDDGSIKILEEYEQKDKRIIVIKNEKNVGLTLNLNKALERASGKYIARMDSDDISKTFRLEKQVEYLDNNPDIDIVGSNSVVINEFGIEKNNRIMPEYDQDIKKMMFKISAMNHPTVMIRKSVINQLNSYDEQFRTSQDLDLWYRAIALGFQFYNIQENLLEYRVDDNYIKKKNWKNRMNEIKVKMKGYKYNKVSLFTYRYLLISFILMVIPGWMFRFLKKMDPRNK